MIKKLKSIYNKELFDPFILGLFINPFYIARRGLARAIKSQANFIHGKVLDIGCGRKPYQHFFHAEQYIGMDVEQSGHLHRNENIDVYYDGRVFPFENETFDSIVCNQTLEHVFTPDLFVEEIFRVLKVGGTMVLTVPFLWDEHEQPYDYARYSSFGLKSLLENHHFQVIYQGKSVNNIQLVFQLWNAYWYKILHTKSKLLNLFFTILLMCPTTIVGLFLSLVFPKNNDLFLDNIIVVKK